MSKVNYFVPSKLNQLQIDIDTNHAHKVFKKQLQFLRDTNHVEIVRVKKHRSRSGNRHITVVLKKRMPDLERVLLQALLGSDLKREMCNYGRVKNNAPFPILFITKRKRRI